MPEVIAFNAVCKYRSALSLLKIAAGGEPHIVEVRPEEHEDGVYVAFTLDNGLRVETDTAIGSALFPSVCVNFTDLYNFYNNINEDLAFMWYDGGKLYSGAEFDAETETFAIEYEYGIVPKEGLFDSAFGEFSPDIELPMSYVALTTIAPTVRNYSFVEIHRKNGLLSFRTGCDGFSVSTLMCADHLMKDTSLPDFELRIPTEVFKLIPLMGDLGLSTLQIDTTHHQIGLCDNGFRLVYDYLSTCFPTGSAENLEKLVSFDMSVLAERMKLISALNYLNSSGKLRMETIDDNHVEISYAVDGRYSAIFTVECHVYEKGIVTEFPTDMLELLCSTEVPALTLMYSKDTPGYLMGTFKNAVFGRKCVIYPS